ncbi:vacuolar protein sorting-associated protein 33A-like protein [Leptotrombidium deliense]|uniref:procollagen-proline 4-dioxygenase n=1 Tax=Leptotrombidium deliense TaxID=299467 RepID=A0A443SI45_9ACAR|nr:vacuolar protein sorting-associated protein 33A-like protein [Leptotrombidium deliense]
MFLSHTQSYIDEFGRSAGRPEFQNRHVSEEIIGNPLQAFQLLKRLTINWKTVKQLMSSTNVWNNIDELEKEYQSLMPSDDDLNGAALSLIRLQDTYNLTISDLASGTIHGVNSYVEMTARDCLFLGKHAFNNGYYGLSLEWFHEALTRAHYEGNATAPVDEIIPFYTLAAEIHDDLLPTFWEKESGEEVVRTPDKMRLLDGDNDDYRNYQALCRGESIKKPVATADLKCYMTNRGHPWLIMQPVKVEELHIDPYIAIFHHLLTDNESETIKTLSAPMLQRSMVQSDYKNGSKVSDVRTSQTAWFSNDESEIAARLSRRIEAATGLSTDMDNSHAELMQVANYGMGGHYTPHYDYLFMDIPEEERNSSSLRDFAPGDRTATVMFYLSDVTKGGGTVFPKIGVAITPEKNSAAFWYNLRRNGEGIIETTHGACPVLMGEKWVSNHWIREVGQTFRRLCSLNPNE